MLSKDLKKKYFNNENISVFKRSMFEPMEVSMSKIYCSELFNNSYNMWSDVRFVSYLLDKSYAELNIILDLSENSFIKLSIFRPIINCWFNWKKLW